MEDRTTVELYERAIRFARRRIPTRATDFAAWVVIQRLEGRGKKQKLRFAWIDFLREECGSTNRGDGSRDAMKRPGEYFRFDNMGSVPSPPLMTESMMDLARVLSVLPKKYRLLVKLLYRGYKMEEIGRKFKVTESRVSQLFKEACRIARTRLLPSTEIPEEDNPPP